MDEEIRRQKLSVLESVFTPSAPIVAKDLFFGRIEQVKRTLLTVREKGRHAILYGERGVGKTSLANVLEDILQDTLTVKVTCNRTDTFKDIWEESFRKVFLVTDSAAVGFQAPEVRKKIRLSTCLPDKDVIDSSDIVTALEKLSNPVLFIFDEFDSLATKDIRVRFADTVKAFSDNAPHVSLILVGVAESVNDLLGDHASIERCISQIKLPRMSEDELGEIIDNGLNKLEMEVDPFVRLAIIEFSQGFPHFTHLLAKYSAWYALRSSETHIAEQHFELAVSEALENVQESVREAYQKAVLSTRKQTMFKDVLSACALVRLDEHGTFRASDLDQPLLKLTKKEMRVQAFAYHLTKLCEDDRGRILQLVGRSKQHRYRFRNPLIRAYLRLKLHQTGHLAARLSADKNPSQKPD